MHKVLVNTSVTKLADRISQDKHLEDLYLEYLRISSSVKDLRGFQVSVKTRNSWH